MIIDLPASPSIIDLPPSPGHEWIDLPSSPLATIVTYRVDGTLVNQAGLILVNEAGLELGFSMDQTALVEVVALGGS